LESGQPSLRFSSNGPALSPICAGDFHTTLSLYRGGFQNTTLETLNDFSIAVGVSDSTTANLILTTRDPGSMIRFATTSPNSGADAERMRIIDIGHVGIASVDPKELLQIGPRLTFHVGSFNDFFGFNVYVDGSNNQKRINNGYSSVLDFASNGKVRLGLGGTGSADGAVDFQEPSGTFNGLSLYYDSNGNGIYAFGSGTPETGTRLFIKTQDYTGATNALRITNSDNSQLIKLTNAGTLVVGYGDAHSNLAGGGLQVKGDVIIGENYNDDQLTANFSHKLHVDGVILTKEIAVRTGGWWPDYVFSEDYNLMAIDELKEYIYKNKHLPGIPNQSEVAEHGVLLGKLQATFLEKIEQLTLYVIRLSEQNNSLKREIDQIRESMR